MLQGGGGILNVSGLLLLHPTGLTFLIARHFLPVHDLAVLQDADLCAVFSQGGQLGFKMLIHHRTGRFTGDVSGAGDGVFIFLRQSVPDLLIHHQQVNMTEP
ncbi:hypothetical protein D3C80_1979290 [compost metagenome]